MVKYVYTLGASGERVKVEELDRTVEYSYDELYRLTSETITKGKTKTTYTYAYDSVSNRTLKNVDGVETTYVYNELNQLVSEDGTTYEYNNAGNLVRVVGVGKTAIYSYNSENKLIKATVQQGNNVVVETYTYDYAGNRTSKTTTINNHVEKVYYLNDNSSLTNVLVEYSANGDEICYYTIGADLVSQEVNGKVFTYLYDGHGTVRALANENGKVTDTYCYDAFGNLISSTGSTANSYRYCGEQFDSTTGLYYLRARYMNPSVGRFISMDTYQGYNADPISLHKYLYANSNPVSNSDPSGYLAVEGNLALALSGDEYAINRLAIQMTSSEMGYYSRDPRSVGQHISDVLTVGLAIIAALTNVVVFAGYMYDFVALVEQLSSGNGIVLPSVEYRDDVINNSLTDAQTDSKKEKKLYSVYKLVDPTKTDSNGNQKVEYVGRTISVSDTARRHSNNPYRSHLKLIVIKSKLTYLESRGLEQYYIEYYSTLNKNKNQPINNQINGVNPKNGEKYKKLMKIASDYLDAVTYVG